MLHFSFELNHNGPYTRVTEWKNLTPNEGLLNWTTITVEEPCDYTENNFERFYPVRDLNGLNQLLYKKYKNLIPLHMTFIGRCGLYSYLDMHQAVSSALAISNNFKKNNIVEFFFNGFEFFWVGG